MTEGQHCQCHPDLQEQRWAEGGPHPHRLHHEASTKYCPPHTCPPQHLHLASPDLHLFTNLEGQQVKCWSSVSCSSRSAEPQVGVPGPSDLYRLTLRWTTGGGGTAVGLSPKL